MLDPAPTRLMLPRLVPHFPSLEIGTLPRQSGLTIAARHRYAELRPFPLLPSPPEGPHHTPFRVDQVVIYAPATLVGYQANVMPTTGRWPGMAAAEPRNGARPKLKMPPSAATIQ